MNPRNNAMTCVYNMSPTEDKNIFIKKRKKKVIGRNGEKHLSTRSLSKGIFHALPTRFFFGLEHSDFSNEKNHSKKIFPSRFLIYEHEYEM